MLTINARPARAGKLGKLSPHTKAQRARLEVGPALTGLPPAPALTDWLTRVQSWPMYGNDLWGDCVFAMIGHVIEALTTYGQGATVQVSNTDVLKGYSDVTGFDPNAGPPGSNPTDNGTVIQDALDYWRKTGIGGHKILAFAEVDHTNPTQLATCLNLFGHLCLGFRFPASAMGQFDKGQPWDVVPGSPIEGGHAVDLGLDAGHNTLTVVTWAALQDMTPAFWSEYVDEAWCVISQEWIDATGGAPNGLNMNVLGAAFIELTGQPSPFPPAPTPGPVPVVDSRDLFLVIQLRKWLGGRHVDGNARAVAAVKNWMAQKGLK